jgi:hypothetical protein
VKFQFYQKDNEIPISPIILRDGGIPIPPISISDIFILLQQAESESRHFSKNKT